MYKLFTKICLLPCIAHKHKSHFQGTFLCVLSSSWMCALEMSMWLGFHNNNVFRWNVLHPGCNVYTHAHYYPYVTFYKSPHWFRSESYFIRPLAITTITSLINSISWRTQFKFYFNAIYSKLLLRKSKQNRKIHSIFFTSN